MDDVVTVEYRGVSRTLVYGEQLVVESCEAGVLRLRSAPAPAVVADQPQDTKPQSAEDDNADA